MTELALRAIRFSWTWFFAFIGWETTRVRVARKIITELPARLEKAKKKGKKWVYIYLPPFHFPPDKEPARAMNCNGIASILLRRNGKEPVEENKYKKLDFVILPKRIQKMKVVCVLFPVQPCDCGGISEDPCWICDERTMEFPSYTFRKVKKFRVLAISTETY